jgi:hypothetical protein
MMSDDEIEINPRSAHEAGQRLVILASLLRRNFLDEQIATETLEDEVADERFDLIAWLADQALDSALTTEERGYLETKVGSVGSPNPAGRFIPIAAITTLGWYLKLIPDMPDLLSEEPQNVLIDRIPAPWDSVLPWLDRLSAHPLDELARQRELAEIWVWRTEIEEQRRQSFGSALATIAAAIRETAIETVNAGLISRHSHGDLLVAGTPFALLSDDEQEAVAIEAIDRLHALNWLSGYGESWSEVPLDI